MESTRRRVGEQGGDDEGTEGDAAPLAGLAKDDDGAKKGTGGGHKPGYLLFAKGDVHRFSS
jgi:hypothetical protein